MTQKKKQIVLGIVVLAMILAVIVLTQVVGVSILGAFSQSGGCVSVVFDKHTVMGADKIVVREGETVITITDKALVREIAAEFVVANRTDLCGHHADKWLEIYNGEKLVRRIHWNDHEELVEVYEADDAHWVWPSDSQIGQIYLSRKFVDRLDEILKAHGG